MNRMTIRMLCIAGFALVGAACSQGGQTAASEGGATSTGGTSSSGGASTSSTGGSSTASTGGNTVANTGGVSSTGGSAGGVADTGGSVSNSGGITESGGVISSGGVTPSGGANKTGGVTSAGGATTGSGGAKTGGTTITATGGSAAGSPATGGIASTGGVKTGGTTTATGGGAAGAPATGGTTGGGGGGGGGAGTSVDPSTVVPDLMGFYWEGTCSGNVPTHGKNCPFSPTATTATCPSGTTWDTRGTIKSQVLNVKGTPGTEYTINFEVRGVLGTRCYTGGTPAVANMTPNATGANNTWYVGGVQANNSIWSTYELHVSPPVPGEANVYFFNAFPSNPSWCEKEATYQVGYTASFKVLGGGTMKFTIHDANCMTQQNCGGNDSATTCDAPRTIDLSGMSPAASFGQPPVSSVSGSTYYPQWLYFDVKSVTSP